jgi:acyl-CoA reductase-like NAD-dependent aldehyde dehydrogenase
MAHDDSDGGAAVDDSEPEPRNEDHEAEERTSEPGDEPAAAAPESEPSGDDEADDPPAGLAPRSPLDGAGLELVEPTPLEEIAAEVEAARQAQRSWAERSLADRIDVIAQVKQRILARAERIADVVRSETAKPTEEALLAEVLPSADLVDYWVDSVEELLEGTPVELSAVAYPSKRGRIHRDARGVVALIAPWNFPVAIPLRTVIPALLCGNAVVFKPSEIAPRSGALLGELFEGLLPDHLLTILQGDATVGAALVASDVDLVVFTGSVAAGRSVARACAERFVPCSLELGGKDAAIVLADCDLPRAARGVVWGAFNNCGQNCAAIERVYVVEAVADEFIAEVVAETERLKGGRDVSVLTTAAQRRTVEHHLEQALADGAEVLTGGEADDEGALPPTVLRLDTEETPAMREETFGPLLPIRVVADEDEAIGLANDSPYALTTSVWTKRVSYAHRLARRLRASVVTINNHGFTAALPQAPWTGVGQTGGGITGSPHALAALCRVRFVLEDRNRAKSEAWWYPYTPVLRAIALSMAAVRGGVGLVARVVALLRLIALLPKRLLGG